MNARALQQAVTSLRAQCTTPGQRKIFDAIVRCPDGQEWLTHRDAANLPYAARQLEHVMEQVVEQPYPALAFVGEPTAAGSTALVKWNRSVPAGAKFFTYRTQDMTTAAAFIATLAAGSLPRPALRGAEVQGRLQVMAEEYGYTADELRTANFVGGESLDSTMARAVALGHAITANRTAAWGREDLLLPGLLNHPYITASVAAEKDAGGTSWANATAAEMYADVVSLVHGIANDSRSIYKANVVALPGAKLRLLETTVSDQTAANGAQVFVMELLRKALPGVEFKECNDLEAANSLGNLDEDAMIAFNDSPEYVEFVVSLWLEQHPMQQHGLDFVVPTESKIGGIKCPHPLSIARMDGI